VAVVVGEWLRNRNYKRQQKDRLLRDLIHYGYQLSSNNLGTSKNILGSLNEIKYWYHDDQEIKGKTLRAMDLMQVGGTNGKDALVELLLAISNKEGLELSKEEIVRVFASR
tara:strand:+ start:2163 stop:2495 length:333 start_codon:yes stop_codon:yes gene_type:complete